MSTQAEAKTQRAQTKTTIAFVLAFMLACLFSQDWAGALRLPAEQLGLQVRVYAQWNQQYLCLAAKVPDPMLTGSSTAPMSAPEHDDAIEFSLEIPAPQGASAHRLIVSAAGGMILLTRDARGEWRPDSSWVTGPRTLKFVSSPDGTLNNPSDEDVGFVVECAIPWEFLGGEPAVGKDIGFNVVCWLQGDDEGLASWSPTVREPQHVGDAARWGRMHISPGSTLAKAQGTRFPCPFVAHMPFIDGKLSANEWLAAGILEFDKPKPSPHRAARPAERTGVVGTLLAVYRYDWQAHPAPHGGTSLWRPDGFPNTSDQPKEAAGPWYSYELLDWHRQQLEQIQRAGIDIILPEYRGDEKARRTWARIGLDRLAQALKERRANDRGYPLVGMMLDTKALEGLDLKSAEAKQRLYGMVRDFFLHLPREFWAELGTQPRQQSAGGVPVLLGEPDTLADWDGSFLSYCQERFAEDFGGARLAWLGSSAWRAKGAESFYAYIRLPQRIGFAQEGAAGATAVALSPGYCPPPGAGGEVRPRREGQAYRSDWQRALAARPELVLINSWNDFANATEIAPSRQHGVAYVDITRYFQSRLGSERRHQLWLKQKTLPRVLLPGADYQVEFLVENAGVEDLRTGRRVSVDYRIVRQNNGKVMQKKSAAQGLAVMAGQTRRLPLVISTKDTEGKPLAPGDYLFSLEVVTTRIAYLRSPWFARTAAELAVPITVGQPPARKATVISTSLPSFIEAGATENIVVRLRNDGAEKWRPQAVWLSYHWMRHEDDLLLPSTEARKIVVWDGARAELPREVKPGEVVSAMIPLRALAPEGSPLPPTGAEDLWHYRVQWDLVDAQGRWFSEHGSPAGEEALQVVARDWGAVFESAQPPAEMEAGQPAAVEVEVANAGHHRWEATASYYLAYSWYRWDGRAEPPEHYSGPTRTLLPSEVAPGGKITLTAQVNAPPIPGMYWLAWDMVCEGQSLSDTDAGRARSLLPRPVLVRGGKMRSLDLSSLMNVAAITTDSHRAWGDLDGAGRSLPDECLPPDLSVAQQNLYPAGYYAPTVETPIPFAFPESTSGVAGAVACNGQTVPLGDAAVKLIHLLAASTAGSREAEMGLKYEDGSSEEIPVSVPSWTEPASGGLASGALAAYTPYVRTLSGDDTTTPAYLYLLTLTPRLPSAVSLELPRAPWIKILAITVETE